MFDSEVNLFDEAQEISFDGQGLTAVEKIFNKKH